MSINFMLGLVRFAHTPPLKKIQMKRFVIICLYLEMSIIVPVNPAPLIKMNLRRFHMHSDIKPSDFDEELTGMGREE